MIVGGCACFPQKQPPEDVQVTHITEDNYQSLFQFNDNSIVLWVDEAVLWEDGVQQKLRKLYNDHVKIMFIRDTIGLNDVVDYLGMDRKHGNVIHPPYNFVGILAFKMKTGEPALVEVYAETLDLKQSVLMDTSNKAMEDFWEE